MFCIYCRTPFDENIDNICTCCGRRLFKEDRSRRGRRQKEWDEPEQTEPELPDILELPEDLLHTCRFCGVEFPVLCTNCTAPVSADTIIPPVGWLPCEVCNQSFWVICPHCQRPQQESLPREIQVQPLNPLQEQGQPQEQPQHGQQPGQQAQGQGRRSGRVTDMRDSLDTARPPRPPYQPPASDGPRRPPGPGTPIVREKPPKRKNRPWRRAPFIAGIVAAAFITTFPMTPWYPPWFPEFPTWYPQWVQREVSEDNTPPVVIATPDNTATPTPTPEPAPTQAPGVQPGDRIENFGTYWTGFGSGNPTSRPLTWIVLEVQGDRALVISETTIGLGSSGVFEAFTGNPTWTESRARSLFLPAMIDCDQPMDASHRDSITGWHSPAECNLFSDEEKSRIIETTVRTPLRAGGYEETQDHLFSLSEEEYEKYREHIPVITTAEWWLRSPYEGSHDLGLGIEAVAAVGRDGEVYGDNGTYGRTYRPAMWIILG